MRSYSIGARYIFILLFITSAVNAEVGSAITSSQRIAGYLPPEPTKPVCTDEPESSLDSITERALGGNTILQKFAGTEQQCLKDNKLIGRGGDLINPAKTSGQDLNKFFSSCEFKKHSPYQDIRNISEAIQLQNRDTLINGFWQSLASRSHGQIVCREKTLGLYLNGGDKKNQLDAKVSAKFNESLDRVRGLLLAKQTSNALNQKAVFEQYDCTGLAYIFCKDVASERTKIAVANYDGAIAAEISKIPYGYEPDVATALVAMAESGKFDANQYALALSKTDTRYRELDKYYSDRTTVSNNGGATFCIDRAFKEKAVSSGVADKLLEKMQGKTLSSEQKAVVHCRLKSKYVDIPENVDQVQNGVFMVGAGAAAILTAVPTEGGSLVAYGALASAGLSVSSFLLQVQQAYKACHQQDFVLSPTGAEVCNPEENFEKEINQFSLSSCLKESGYAALEAIPVPFEIAALIKARRAVKTGELVDEAIEALYGAKNIPPKKGVTDVIEGEEIVVMAKRGSQAKSAGSNGERTSQRKLLEDSRRDRDALDNFVQVKLNLDPKQAVDEINKSGIDAFLEKHKGQLSAKDREAFSDMHAKLIKDRTAVTGKEVETDLSKLKGDDHEIRNVECGDLNKIYADAFDPDSGKCHAVTFNKENRNYCACGGSRLGNFVAPCASGKSNYLTPDQIFDFLSLPQGSSIDVCRRIKIDKGSTCFHGGVAPAFTGFGGGAQMFCEGVFVGRPGNEESMASAAEKIKKARELSLIPSDRTSFQKFTAVNYAPVFKDEKLLKLTARAAACKRDTVPACNPKIIESLRQDYSNVKGSLSAPDTVEFEKYLKYLEGKIQLLPDGTLSGT